MAPMDMIQTALQLIVALGILNVWLLRFGKSTSWRGGDAKNMREEFEVYGLPNSVMIAVGSTKVTLAVALVVGIWVPILTLPASVGLALLMGVAIAMHFKVKDPPKKSVPAMTIFTLSLAIAVLSRL